MPGPSNIRYENLIGTIATIFAFGRGDFAKLSSTVDGIVEALAKAGTSNPTNTPVQLQADLANVRGKDPRAGQIGANDFVTRQYLDPIQAAGQASIRYLEITVGSAAGAFDSATQLPLTGRVLHTETKLTGTVPYAAGTTITVGQVGAGNTDIFQDATQNNPQGPVQSVYVTEGSVTPAVAGVVRVTVAGTGGPAGASAVVGVWYVAVPLA